jgi:redox-sensitive bicupin YhaK (pirin superfamily)
MPEGHTTFIFVIDGALTLPDGENTPALLSATQLGILGDGTTVCVTAGDAGARFLLVAAKPLNEPITRYGPFVMNTRHEIEQAIADYNAGRF